MKRASDRGPAAGGIVRTRNDNGRGEAVDNREGPGRRVFDDLFDRFPHGLLVVDRDGGLVGMNESCRTLLREAASRKRQSARDCCDLICRRLEDEADACLSQRAFDKADSIPEIRIDLPTRANADAAWVTVVPNCPSEAFALFQLRPGRAGDRRRRSAGHEGPGATLRLSILGQTALEGDSGPIGGAWVEQRPGQLLKYLACQRGRPAQTEEIAEALWPGSDARSLSSVRYFVHVLRSRLEPTRDSSASSPIVSTRGGYCLDPDRVWIDADEFEGLVAAGLAALLAREHDAARNFLEQATELYNGDLLADDPYAEWVLPERERMRELATRALRALLELHLAAGDTDGAEQPARRLADIESYDTDAQRVYIEVCLKQGRRTEAARRYELFQRRTMNAFGETPDFRLSDLAQDVDSESTGSESAIRGGVG
jgi:DNA-binding SARP family transcriptional activator